MSRQKAPRYLPLFPYLEAHKAACLLAPGELVIDNFAGIGGASSGMEAALGRPVDWAINHDPVAVSLHRVNHPHSHHSVEDVWHFDPLEATNGQQVALAWFSPTCTHFSKAKGAPLVDRKIRGLAWVAVKWAHLVRPRVIILENVEEFQDWGPLRPDPNGSGLGYPDPAQKGRTFNSFVNALRKYGYQVEWRELRACDYGTPTIRKRLFLVARCDGLPIIWPAPTHAAPADPRVKSGHLKPYRTAAECIDWDLPCPSIFDRKKPLVKNTLNRVAQGLRRFVLEAGKPFIVTCNHAGEGFRGQDAGEPFRTITAAHEAHGAVMPVMINKQHGNPARRVDTGLSTITTNHNKNELLSGYFVPRNSEREGQLPRAATVGAPALTVTTSANGARLTIPFLTKFNTGSTGQDVRLPIATVMAGGSPARESTGNPHGLVSAALIKTDNQRSRTSCTTSMAAPAWSIVTRNNQAVSTAHLVRHMSGGLAPEHASYRVDEPGRTVLATGGPQALVSGALVACGGRGAQARPKALNERMHTVTSKADMTLTTAHLTAYYSRNGDGDHGQSAGEPLRTIPTVDRFGPVATTCVTSLSDAQLARARQVHDFLAAYLTPEQLAPYQQDGLIVLTIHGEQYLLADIGMRMLTPRELARCQGFPDTFVLEQTAEGKPISKARQVRGIGNSVCPQLAQVLTHAQLTAVAEEAAD